MDKQVDLWGSQIITVCSQSLNCHPLKKPLLVSAEMTQPLLSSQQLNKRLCICFQEAVETFQISMLWDDVDYESCVSSLYWFYPSAATSSVFILVTLSVSRVFIIPPLTGLPFRFWRLIMLSFCPLWAEVCRSECLTRQECWCCLTLYSTIRLAAVSMRTEDESWLHVYFQLVKLFSAGQIGEERGHI